MGVGRVFDVDRILEVVGGWAEGVGSRERRLINRQTGAGPALRLLTVLSELHPGSAIPWNEPKVADVTMLCRRSTVKPPGLRVNRPRPASNRVDFGDFEEIAGTSDSSADETTVVNRSGLRWRRSN